MNDRIGEPLSIKDVARQAGYSLPWIETIFKRGTGQSLLSYLMKLRIDRAKNLLLQTDLSITEISFEAGFNSYTRFTIAFKKQEGISPTEFRRRAKLHGEIPAELPRTHSEPSFAGRQRLLDTFAEPQISPCWKMNSGRWLQEDNQLTGTSAEDLTLSFVHPLPENFSFDLDFQVMEDPHVRIVLHGEDPRDMYLIAAIGRNILAVGEFTFPKGNKFWNYGAGLLTGRWQRLRMELVDDKLKIVLDDQVLLDIKDPFPPTYSGRCHFTLAGWQNTIHLRRFLLRDHGFLGLIPPVRQADSLYNSGVYDKALETYLRLLESAIDPQDITELQYKVGMCFLKNESFQQAAAWLSKVTALPQSNYWSQCAKQSMLELHRLQRNHAIFIGTARALFDNSANRDFVRSSMERSKTQLSSEGFFETALSCYRTLCEVELSGSIASLLSRSELPDLLFLNRRYSEAESLLHQFISTKDLPAPILLAHLVSLADVQSSSGNFDASQKTLDRVATHTDSQPMLARCDVIHGTNLRGQGRLRDALAFLAETPTRRKGAGDLAVFAGLIVSHLYCMMGEPGRAKEVIADIDHSFPGHAYSTGFRRSSFLYPVLHLEGDHAGAAELLLIEAKRDSAAARMADQMTRAGILFELAGDPKRAESVWAEVTRRFLPDRCCFYGDLARSFLRDEADTLERMPYPAVTRAEMFYLAGLLFRNRENEAGAQMYFRLATKEDPTLNWFTWMAEKEVVSRQS